MMIRFQVDQVSGPADVNTEAIQSDALPELR
jgi:hypothetical protein